MGNHFERGVYLYNLLGRLVCVPPDQAPDLIREGFSPVSDRAAPAYSDLANTKGGVAMIRPGGLGDALCLLPAAKFLKWENPKCRVGVITSGDFARLFLNEPYVDEVFVDGDTPRGYGRILDFDNTWGVEQEIAAQKRGEVPPYRGRMWANHLGLYGAFYGGKLHPTSKEIEQAEFLWGPARPRIAFFQASSNIIKRPARRKMDTLKKVLRGLGNVKALDEADEAGRYPWTLRQISAFIKTSDVVVGLDSGPIHMAVGYDKRIIMLPCNTDPRSILQPSARGLAITPRCGDWPCWWGTSCMGNDRPPYPKANGPFPCAEDWTPENVHQKVFYQLKEPEDVFAVALTWDNIRLTRDAIESLRSFHETDLLVVDNGSTDGTHEWLGQEEVGYVVEPGLGVAEAINVGLRYFLDNSSAEYFFLFNNDVVLGKGYLEDMVRHLRIHPDCGLVVGTNVTEEEWRFSIDNFRGEITFHEMIDLIPGDFSATLIRRSAIEQVGFFDPTFKPRYIEDNDYVLRLRLGGWECHRTTHPFWHLLGATEKAKGNSEVAHADYWWRNKAYYKEKWGSDPHDVSQFEPVYKRPFNGKKEDPGIIAMQASRSKK